MGVSAETKAANARIILDVLAAKGGDGRFLRAIAGRESGLNDQIRHQMSADVLGSIKAWRRNHELFTDNPYYNRSELWDHGKGLFGMMPANHLQRWDPNAHPDVLFNPYVASVVAARLARRCVKAGARTWADVDQCWATGKPTRTESWAPRRQRMIHRLSDLGYPTSLVDEAPNPGGWGLGPQADQVGVLWRLHGSDPSFDEARTAKVQVSSAGIGLGLGLLGLGGALLLARTATS